jgi:hypothetical protein
MTQFAYQLDFHPPLPCIYGPLEYREYRALFERINLILTTSGLEQDFINLTLAERQLDIDNASSKVLDRAARHSVLALRSNIARKLTGLAHREFCARLADSQILQWFLRVGAIDCVKVFSKSTSERFDKWVSTDSIRKIHEKLNALLTITTPIGFSQQTPSALFGLPEPIRFDDIYFDSTCLKVDIHFPVDWVLLRDAARTLMKATVLIRQHGLKHRMPQEPLEFLSEMNTLCMKMAAKARAVDSKKQRKKVLREMKALEKRIANHAEAHLTALKTRRHETDLSEAQAAQIIGRMENVLEKLPAAVKQAHERIIGGRQVTNSEKILSFYDDTVNVMVRGKAGANVEFGNKLWLGENQDGIIVDYKLYQDNPADSILVKPALVRLLDIQNLQVKQVWGDRGLTRKLNSALLERREIGDGFCPRDITELSHRITHEEGFREGLKRRASTEARIGIFKNVFLGSPLLAKGFEHRELAVGWAALTHNLWVVARMAEAEKKRKEDQEKKSKRPKSRVA